MDEDHIFSAGFAPAGNLFQCINDDQAEFKEKE